MRKTSTKSIDGHKYEVGHWDIDKQLGVMTRLIKLLGEPLARTLMGAVSEANKSEKNAGKKVGMKDLLDMDLSKHLNEAVSALIMRLNEDEVKQLLRDVTTDLLCDNKPVVYDTHFMGRIGHLLKVAVFCIRHQYSDFLDVLPGLGGVLGATGPNTNQGS